MNQQEIDDKNEVIAIFDGWEFVAGDPNHKCKFCYAGDEPCTQAIDRFIKNGRTLFHFQLKYHTSWDALIPVIKKIKSMHMDILNQTYVMSYMKAASLMNSSLLTLDIGAAYEGVYQFLQWYQKQGKKADIQIGEIEYRGPNSHCKACEDEANGIKHIRAPKHTCRKKEQQP